MTVDAEYAIAELTWFQRLISAHPELANTLHEVTARDGQVIVEVEGAHYQARMWRAAIEGRIYPSHVDAQGVRRQLVLGRHIQVQVVEQTIRH
jgi:hypothetical protein